MAPYVRLRARRYALSYYGRIRATLGVDVAVAIRTEAELESFVQNANKAGFSPSHANLKNPVCTLLDRESGLEFEIWTRPDGIEWTDARADKSVSARS